MRRIVLRVPEERVDVAFDALLPLVHGGLHRIAPGTAGFQAVDGQTTLVALGAPGELPPAHDLAAAAGDLLMAGPVEEDAGPDLAHALAALLPIRDIGGRVRLRHPEQPPPPPGWIDVLLSRARGFGMGAHPTTRHCIELLLGVEPRGSFADLGCGAGALTITAAKLGFHPVVGVDLVDEITAPAYDNVLLNDVDVDIVTGNLLAMDRLETTVAVINVSEPDVHAHLATAELPELETLIVSGLRNPHEFGAAITGYRALGFYDDGIVTGEDWPAVRLVRAV